VAVASEGSVTDRVDATVQHVQVAGLDAAVDRIEGQPERGAAVVPRRRAARPASAAMAASIPIASRMGRSCRVSCDGSRRDRNDSVPASSRLAALGCPTGHGGRRPRGARRRGWEEIATILLLGWLVVRILAGAIASEAVHRWLRRRRR
jgi:hypothetical protein